jgi:hypothetical protein
MRAVFGLLVFCAFCAASSAEQLISVSTLEELADVATRNGQKITMKPGLYRFTDYISTNEARELRNRKQWHLLSFSGSDNVFDLSRVVIELDTALRSALRPPIHTSDFIVTGRSNTFIGLTITNTGNGTSPGGAALSVTGDGNTLRDCTFHVRGSFPYGYGDLFGKGGPDVISHHKKSGVHVTGNGTAVLGCKLYMRSFGHGYFVQKDAANVRFEDCYVEGEMRRTEDMLAETSGPAFKVGFRTVAKNRRGENRVTPGYMKSLAEDGFRTYGQHKNLSFKNCTARNMRGGFELRTKTGVQLENCTAVGNERAFWISSGATMRNCRGDAQYGPLLFVEGDNTSAELELLPHESAATVHALAVIFGGGHKVAIKAGAARRAGVVPIMIGYGTPMMGEGMSPIPEQNARNISLRNETTMPVLVGAKASAIDIESIGPVQENRGKQVNIRSLERTLR